METLEKKFDYCTKELNINTLNKFNLISLTEQRKFDEIEKQIILKNIRENNGLIPCFYIIEHNNNYIMIKNINIVSVLNDFINNKIPLTWMLGLNEKENPYFKDLKSFDQRYFLNFTFRTKLFYDVKNLTELISLSSIL